MIDYWKLIVKIYQKTLKTDFKIDLVFPRQAFEYLIDYLWLIGSVQIESQNKILHKIYCLKWQKTKMHSILHFNMAYFDKISMVSR